MTSGAITVIFWALSILLFTMPIIAYLVKNHTQKPVITQLPTNTTTQTHGIMVHVSGELYNPGIYNIKIGTKVHELLNQVELKKTASINHLNLAKTLRDGQKVTIKAKKKHTSKININLASEKELTTLPGIGKATAKKIVAHRDQVGPFSSISDLVKIKGISKKKASKLKLLIDF